MITRYNSNLEVGKCWHWDTTIDELHKGWHNGHSQNIVWPFRGKVVLVSKTSIMS